MTEQAPPLLAKIKRLVDRTGPLSLADYMHVCMADPEYGYYKTRNVIGRKGDFITAPEISQMFGELIGVWVLAVWKELGEPDPFCLAELGPGKGTLMQDLLRVVRRDNKFMAAVQIAMVETSPHLQEDQRKSLPKDVVASGKITWQFDIGQLPQIPTIFIANEFFDVIPFRQYVKRGSTWHEIAIGLTDSGALQKIALANCLEEGQLPSGADLEPEGSIFEISLAREAIAQTLAERVRTLEGAALLIDYGHLISGFGDTFQAMAAHAFANPLENPGECDLTSHVDFQALEMVVRASGIETLSMTTQGDFLLQLGLLERAGILGGDKDIKTRNRITGEVERLASTDQMGSLFKVMAFASKAVALPGFGGDRP